jgi:hypothetical protein
MGASSWRGTGSSVPMAIACTRQRCGKQPGADRGESAAEKRGTSDACASATLLLLAQSLVCCIHRLNPPRPVGDQRGCPSGCYTLGAAVEFGRLEGPQRVDCGSSTRASSVRPRFDDELPRPARSGSSPRSGLGRTGCFGCGLKILIGFTHYAGIWADTQHVWTACCSAGSARTPMRAIYRLIGPQSHSKWPVIVFTPGRGNIVVGSSSSASKSWIC